jgi:hypothetical protein
MPLKLHLGCGERYLDGYVNIDFPETEHTIMKVKADIYSDIRELFYEEGSIDEIRNHHLLEHFSRQEALKLLLQWRRWLKIGGLLHLETPDFSASVREYIKSGSLKRKSQLGRHVFGSQEVRWAFHYDFWDREKFIFVLKAFGFDSIKIKHFNNSLAQKFPRIPFLNFIGNFIPDFIFEKRSWHKLPNIEVWARKSPVKVEEKKAVESILTNYLVGSEDRAIMKEWLKQIGFDK